MLWGHDILRAFKHLLQQVVLAVPVIGHQLVHWPKNISDLTWKQGSAKLWFSDTHPKNPINWTIFSQKLPKKIVDFDQHVHVPKKESTPSSHPKQSPAAETITDAWITTGPQKMIPGKSSRKLFLFLSFKVAIVTSNLASTKMCGKIVVGNMLAVHKFNKATPHEHVQDQLQSGSMWFPHHRWCLRRPFCGEGRHRVAHILVEKVGMTVSFLTKSAWWPTETKVRIRMPKLHRPSFS